MTVFHQHTAHHVELLVTQNPSSDDHRCFLCSFARELKNSWITFTDSFDPLHWVRAVIVTMKFKFAAKFAANLFLQVQWTWETLTSLVWCWRSSNEALLTPKFFTHVQHNTKCQIEMMMMIQAVMSEARARLPLSWNKVEKAVGRNVFTLQTAFPKSHLHRQVG